MLKSTPMASCKKARAICILSFEEHYSTKQWAEPFLLHLTSFILPVDFCNISAPLGEGKTTAYICNSSALDILPFTRDLPFHLNKCMNSQSERSYNFHLLLSTRCIFPYMLFLQFTAFSFSTQLALDILQNTLHNLKYTKNCSGSYPLALCQRSVTTDYHLPSTMIQTNCFRPF